MSRVAEGNSLRRLRRTLGAHPLGLTIAAAAAWSSGAMLLTALALVAQVRRDGWEGIAAPANLLPAFTLAGASYLLRFLRWHVLARRLATPPGSWLDDSMSCQSSCVGIRCR